MLEFYVTSKEVDFNEVTIIQHPYFLTKVVNSMWWSPLSSLLFGSR